MQQNQMKLIKLFASTSIFKRILNDTKSQSVIVFHLSYHRYNLDHLKFKPIQNKGS